MFSPKLVPLRSLRSSSIDSFSFGHKRCNTSQGSDAFFVQTCDRVLFPRYLFSHFSLFLNFVTIIAVVFIEIKKFSHRKKVFLRGASLQ